MLAVLVNAMAMVTANVVLWRKKRFIYIFQGIGGLSIEYKFIAYFLNFLVLKPYGLKMLQVCTRVEKALNWFPKTLGRRSRGRGMSDEETTSLPTTAVGSQF